MSWLFGISGNYNGLEEKAFTNKNLLFSFQSQNLKIFVGGLKENVFYEKINESEGWVVCGIGIKKNQSNYRFMDFNDWKEFLSKEEKNTEELNGHFIIVRWSNNGIKFFNDKLGVRELYILRDKYLTLFSTRLDFFSFLNHRFEINFEEVGSYWLLSFPPSNNSLFKRIVRLSPGGELKISKDGFIKKDNPLIFDFGNESDSNEFIEDLYNITTFPLFQGKDVSLGLSGGLDSRVLLEMFLNSNSKNWQTHFFGSKDLPDVKIAEQISTENNLPYLNLHEPIPNSDFCLSHLKNCIGQLGLTTPASEILIYPNYEFLFNKGWIIIDGGDGEIHRREFLNRILFLAKRTIIKEDPKNLYKLLSFSRADIFNNEALILMEKGAKKQISGLFNSVPKYHNIGLENWLDLIILKYKLPNFTGPSQSLLDSMSIAYMPYIQPHLLELSFRLSLNKKKNGKIFRGILDISVNKLNSYHLVKNSIYYPYHTNSSLKRFILAYKRKVGKYYKDKTSEEFLDVMKEYIFDTLISAEFNSFSYYNHAKIIRMVSEYYEGNKALANQINWWLTFDIWRSIFLK